MTSPEKPSDEYMRAFDKALSDLHRRILQRDLLNAEIAGLKETVRVLSHRLPLSQEAKQKVARILAVLDYATPNLADSIRSILTRIHPKGMTAVELRNMLEDSGFDFEDFSNPLSACHAALKRMFADNEIELAENKSGKPAYRAIVKVSSVANFPKLSDLVFTPTPDSMYELGKMAGEYAANLVNFQLPKIEIPELKMPDFSNLKLPTLPTDIAGLKPIKFEEETKPKHSPTLHPLKPEKKK